MVVLDEPLPTSGGWFDRKINILSQQCQLSKTVLRMKIGRLENLDEGLVTVITSVYTLEG